MYPSKLSFDSIKQKLAINDDIVVERIVFREQPPYEVEVIYCHSIVDVKALNTETIPLMYRVFEQADTDFFSTCFSHSSSPSEKGCCRCE